VILRAILWEHRIVYLTLPSLRSQKKILIFDIIVLCLSADIFWNRFNTIILLCSYDIAVFLLFFCKVNFLVFFCPYIFASRCVGTNIYNLNYTLNNLLIFPLQQKRMRPFQCNVLQNGTPRSNARACILLYIHLTH